MFGPVSLIVIFLALWAGNYFRDIASDQLIGKMFERSEQTAALLSAVSLDAVITEDRPLLETIIDEIVSHTTEIRAVSFENENGYTLVSWSAKDLERKDIVQKSYTSKIEMEGEMFGRVTIGWDLTDELKEIDDLVWKTQLVTTSILLIVIAFFLATFHFGQRILADREQAYQELEHAKSMTEEATQAKSEFLSSMSHELRTPLNAILGFAQFLIHDKMDPVSDKQASYVDYILRGGHHLLELINQVLDLSKIEAGQLTQNIEAVEITAIIVDSVEVTRAMIEENGRQITITNQTEDHPPTTVFVDALQTKQVLLNLLSNAVKYNRPNGEIFLQLKTGSDKFLRLSVRDTGFGIPECDQHRVFNPFDRLGREARNIEGTGIGLVLAKEMIEKMSGRIGFQSDEGVGSKFFIDLPIDG